jgi:hypothetical protein
MTRFLPLHLGLVAGCLAGLVVHGARALWQPVPMIVTARVRYAPLVEAVPALPRFLRSVPSDAGLHSVDLKYELLPQSAPGDPDVIRVPAHDDCPGPNYAGEVLLQTDLRGRDLRDADFTGAVLRGVGFRTSRLDGARFYGATFDARCRWPAGFDPREHGARRAPDARR